MTIEIRPPEAHEIRAACDTMRAALLYGPSTDEDWEKLGDSWEEHDSITAWDGDSCVGHAGSFRLDTTVPGGARLDTAGLTRIGVLPTYTRRGVLRRMMGDALEAARARGQVLASLRASEAVLYERYGFGVAGHLAAVKVHRTAAGAVMSPAEGVVDLVPREKVGVLVPELYDRCARWRVGTIRRPPWMWRRFLEDALEGSSKGSFVVVFEDFNGAAEGYAHYTVEWTDAHGPTLPGRGEIHDLFGTSPAVERALWQFLLGIDLIEEWTSTERPLDDVARLAIANSARTG